MPLIISNKSGCKKLSRLFTLLPGNKSRDLSQKSLYLRRCGLSRRIKWMQFVCSCRRYFRDGARRGGRRAVERPADGGRVVDGRGALCMGSRDTRNNGSTYTHAACTYEATFAERN